MKKLDNYVINYETLAIVPCENNEMVKVYEVDDEFLVNMNVVDIVKNSCLFFGSSLDGRKDGTRSLLNCEIKVPIIVDDTRNLIIFPTSSYKNKNNVWISYQNLLKYSKYSTNTTLLSFKNNKNISVNVKYNIIDNQIIRCIKLDTIISKRKSDLKLNI